MTRGATLDFKVLGPFEVRRNGEPIDLGGPRGRTLLAALLAETGTVCTIDHLVDAVWGSTDTDRQRALWTAVSRLRSALEPDRPKRSDGTILLTRPTGYILNVRPESIDAHRFTSLVDAGRSNLETNPEVASAVLRDALDLWDGAPFAEFDHAPFAQTHIARLGELKLVATGSCIDADLRCGRVPELLGELEALVNEHPLREDLTALVMTAQSRAGRRTDALRTYANHRRCLVDQIGLDPSPVIRDLESQILAGDPRVQPVRIAGSGPSHRTDNLQPEPNAFVERTEVAEVAAKLAPSTVVTLLGPGGIGKSRCAHAVARYVRESGTSSDGVWYVDLTTLDDAAQDFDVAAAVATVIGAGHQATVPSAADVGTYLEGRDVLVVLDNCEHVRAAVVSFIIDVFDRCSTTTVLATSRVRLGIAGERPTVVPALPLSAAVTLFDARTAELGTGRFPTEDVERLCASLDNYPLALELAAARTRTFTPSEILVRLEQHPGLAQQRVATMSPPGETGHALERRHESLDAALDWSLEQLDPSVLDTLHDSAVFTDDFDLAAAEAVLSDSPADSPHLLDDLGILVEHHLLVRDQSRARFALLEPIRQTLLARAATTTDTRRRHGEHYLDEAARIGDGIHGENEAEWWGRLRGDRTHLREAVRWAGEHDDIEALEVAMRWMPLIVVNGGEIGPSTWAAHALEQTGATPLDAPYTALTAAAGHLTSLRLDDCDRTIGQLNHASDPRVRAISAYLASIRRPADMAKLSQEMFDDAELAGDVALSVLAAAHGQRPGFVDLADHFGNPTLRALARFHWYVAMPKEERLHGASVADECYVAAVASNNTLVLSQGSAIRGGAICRTGHGLDRGAPLLLEALELVLRQRSDQMFWAFMESIAGLLAVMHRDPEASAMIWAAVDATSYTPSNRVARDLNYPHYAQWVESQLSPTELEQAREVGAHLDLGAAARLVRKTVERFVDP